VRGLPPWALVAYVAEPVVMIVYMLWTLRRQDREDDEKKEK